MTYQSAFLYYFIFATVIRVIVLLFDLWLMLTGRKTISARARDFPPLAYALDMLEVSGVMALAGHFMGSNK